MRQTLRPETASRKLGLLGVRATPRSSKKKKERRKRPTPRLLPPLGQLSPDAAQQLRKQRLEEIKEAEAGKEPPKLTPRKVFIEKGVEGIEIYVERK